MRTGAGLAGGRRLGGMVALLAGFGAVSGDADRPVITPLGRWAGRRLEEALPGAADPEISAAELIAEVAESDDAAQRLEAASEWLEQHQPREILEAAESMSPLLRPLAAPLVSPAVPPAIAQLVPQRLVLALPPGPS